MASAYYSTGIKNIEVYMAMPPAQVRMMRRVRWLLPLAALGPVQNFIRRRIERTLPGPNEQELLQSRACFWGRAEDTAGRVVEATLSTMGGYTLTVHTSLIFVAAALAGRLPTGFATPSRALGNDVILQAPETQFQWRGSPPAG